MWPTSAASALATEYNPAAAYAVGDVVKIGKYIVSGRIGGAFDMGVWLILKYGTTLAKTNGDALTGVNWTVNSPASAGISGTRINLRTIGQSPPASGSALAAAYAAISDATAGFNLSDLAFAVSQQWGAGGNLPDSSGFSEDDFEGADAYYVCGRTIPASENAPVSIGVYGAHPLAPAYWDLLPDYTAGEARTDCGAENPYEAVMCGRCGRLLA